jgi:hypothetical protein
VIAKASFTADESGLALISGLSGETRDAGERGLCCRKTDTSGKTKPVEQRYKAKSQELMANSSPRETRFAGTNFTDVDSGELCC